MSSKRRRGRWGLPIIAVLLIAAPAAASVITQNFLRADVTSAAACFTKAEGQDAVNFGTATSDPYADVDLTTTITNADTGVTLLQETVTVVGYEGDRVTYTDVIRYQNNCDYDVSLRLVVENDPAGNADIAGNWTDKAAKLYLSNIAAPGNTLSNATDWDQAPLQINKNDAAGAPTNGTTGTVTITAGSELRGAFVIEVDEQATFAATTGTFRFTAEATAIP